jgi:hypothetical protein
MTLASVLMVVAIVAATLGFVGITPTFSYAVFYGTLGLLGIHILLNAIDEDAHHTDSRGSVH